MMDDLDRILGSEGNVTPSGGFLASVMAAVRACRRYEIPIPFPWKRFAAGLVGGVCCTLLSMIVLAPGLMPGGSLRPSAGFALFQGPGASEVLWAMLALAVTLLSVRLTVAWTSD